MVRILRLNWIYRCQLRKFCYRTMDELLPPSNVKGMTVLDRGMFKKTLEIPCLVVPPKHIKQSVNLFKPFLLKLFKFRPVQDFEENKILFLNPKKFDEFKVKFDESQLEDIKLVKRELTINYSNWKADEILRAVVPPDLDSVSGYSLIGHIVHLNLRPELDEYKQLIGQVLLDKIPNSRTVITKAASIDTEFRNFNMEVLAGDDDFIAQIKENKCCFKLDFSKVYWNPRLSTEHSRVVEYLNKGDVLFDVFAGIGPFAIPAAKKGVKVFANDLNPHSIHWLNANLKLNKVPTESIQITNKDGAIFIKEEFKTNFIKLTGGDFKVLITMNLPSIAKEFLKHFRGLFSMEAKEKLLQLPVPEAFVYCFTKNAEDPPEAAKKLITDELDFNDSSIVGEPHFVRNVAPNKDMFRVPVRLSHEFLLGRKRQCSPVDEVPSKQSNGSES